MEIEGVIKREAEFIKIKIMNRQFLLKVTICLFLATFISCRDNKSSKNSFNNKIQIDKDGNSEIDGFNKLKIKLADTIFLGGNVGQIINYEPKRNDIEYLLSVIIENEYENGIFVKDTFSDGTLTPWFGVYANKKGFKNVKGIILEEALNDKKTKNDSILRIERTFIHFSKKVYVIDSIFKMK